MVTYDEHRYQQTMDSIRFYRSLDRNRLPGRIGRETVCQWDLCPCCGDLCELHGDAVCYECQIADSAHEVETCPLCGGDGEIETMVATWNGFGLRTQKCWMCEENAAFDYADEYER